MLLQKPMVAIKMKNGQHRMILNFVILFLISLSSCNDFQNYPGVSDNIENSKKRGVYICEYEAHPNPMKINDTIVFNVEMAWLERQWKYGKNYNNTNPMEGYQLVILTKDNIHKGFDKTWTIGIGFERHIRPCGKSCLMTDFEKLPISNKEIWKVQGGRRLNAEAVKIILGDFILYKKN